nr:hypothetical protein CFP56_39617 [Quercus suber]
MVLCGKKAIAASKDHYDFEVFRGHGLEYDLSGLTGNTLDSHKLMHFAGQQGHDKQHNLMEVLSLGYFTQANLLVTNCQIDRYSFSLNRAL